VDHFTVAVNTGGERRTIVVHVYPTQEAMVQAGRAFNDDPDLGDQTIAICQAWGRKQNPQAIIRVCHQRMLDHIFIHEIVHAAQAVYRWTNEDIDQPASAHFTHHNEQFAHMISDMYMSMRASITARYTITIE
jgi:hypothetical protein